MSPKHAMDGPREAIEDQKRDEPPKGAPTTYGPMVSRGEREVAVNPFWSEKAKDEAVLRSLRPQGLPEDAATSSRSMEAENDAAGMPDLRQVLTMMLQQNQLLRQEIAELRGRVESQPVVTKVVEQVVIKEGQSDGTIVKPLPIEDRPVSSAPEDVKSDDVGLGQDWKTPPESVSAKRSQEVAQEAVGSASPEGPMDQGTSSAKVPDQQQILGQVTQALTSLVEQLTAASGAPVQRCMDPRGAGRWTASTGEAQQTAATGAQAPRCMDLGGAGTWSASAAAVPSGTQGIAGDGAIQRGGHGQGQGHQPNGHDGNGHQHNGHGGYGPPPPMGGSGCGGGGIGGGMQRPGGLHTAPFPLPQELSWFPGAGETIRTADITPLPAIKEGEFGGVVVGDWMALITPVMKDLSVSSGQWWDAVVTEAQTTYNTWLHSEPLQRLYLAPTVPGECSTTWARLEQRGQAMLMQAMPEGLKSEMLSNRVTHTVEIIYKVLTRYQPGGLGEKSMLLRQLVDGRSPSTLIDSLDQIKAWKRSLRRAQELRVTVPDPTLLIGSVDRMSGVVVKSSPQAAFRLNSMRTQLMVDVSPTLPSVVSYADSVIAEAESLFHGGVPTSSTVKVKALEGGSPPVDVGGKGDGKGKSGEKGSKGDRPLCKYFGTDEGCKKGADCGFLHDWSTIDKKGRCWTCSSTKHSRRDCTVKISKGAGDGGGKDKKEGGKGKQTEAAPSLKKADQPAEAAANQEDPKSGEANGGHPRAEGDLARTQPPPVQELMQEAASLLKSLKGPMLRAIKVSSLEVQSGGKALLDGGATHALRTAKSQKECAEAIEVRVELAQGSATLRQLPWSKTLLSLTPVQSIIPLGILAEMGYCVHWEGTLFELTDPTGCILDTQLENGCPTVSEELGLELIEEVERHFVERRARLAILKGEENEGGLEDSFVEELKELKMMFPEVPAELLARVLPNKPGHPEGNLPWNRHQRRRFRRAQQVVVHLFSGKDAGFWKKELETPQRAVICVDTELDSRQDLHRDDVMEYLLELADSGRAVAWLGGPPCRTMSRLRYRQPGPPPLRSRLGPERFGLAGLNEALLRQVQDDTVLWLRHYYLYHRAKKANVGKTLYLSEQPEDPEKYLTEEAIKKQRYPSYWAFPEWESMREANQFVEVRFDQGPMGHAKRKPTMLGTNVYELQQLQDVRGAGSEPGESPKGMTLEERIKSSRSWSAWAPGLKKAIAVALKKELDYQVKRMTIEGWKKHLQNDHQPYYRGCRTCLEACGQGRHHRRVTTQDSYTLAIDLAGPFKRGDDQLGPARYMLVGSFTIPTTCDGDPLHQLPERKEDPTHRCQGPGGEGTGTASVEDPTEQGDEDLRVEGGIFNDASDEEKPKEQIEEGGQGAQGEPAVEGPDPLQEEEDHEPEAPKDEKKDDMEGWKKLIEAEQSFKIKQVTLLEILPDRGGQSVISGLSRMYARLCYMGLPLMRLHSDRAGELRSRAIRKWAEDRKVYRTYTDGDSYKSNGRAEAEIGMIKKQVRTLLKETGEEAKNWPLAARHAAERRLRMQLADMGLPTRELLTFGQEAYATQKIWNEKYQDWKLSRRKVKVLGPDVAMSAAMPGYYVRGEDGKFFHSSDVVVAEGPPPQAQLPQAIELGELSEPGPRMRIYGKTPMLSRLQVTKEEAEERRLRGIQLLMEELNIYDELTAEELGGGRSDEATGSDRFLRALMADVEGLAEGLMDEDQIQRAATEKEISEGAEAQEVFLQTRMYSLSEVKSDLAAWKASMESEFKSLTEETGAIRVISEAHAEELRRDAERRGIHYDRIPAKAIFQRKAGSGKRKCRACACGNFMAPRPLTETYAGGTGATEVCSVLRKCGLRSWSAVTMDVKTAFLRAPKDHTTEVVVVQPPQVFILAGVCAPGTLWLVDRAIYGLITSPKEWTQFRNERVMKFTWSVGDDTYRVQKTEDQDVWKIIQAPRCVDPGGEGTRTAVAATPMHRCTGPREEGTWAASIGGPKDSCGQGEGSQARSASMAEDTKTQDDVVGYFVTYVDDMLAVGDRHILEGFVQRMQQEWEIGVPEWLEEEKKAIRFLGMELELRKGVIRLHQQSFVQSMLDRYGLEKGAGLSAIKTPEEEESISPADVQEAQKQTGELLWLAGRTRPDICYGVSLMSQFATKMPKGVQAIGREIRCYLRTQPNLALEYGPLQEGDFGEQGSQRRARHESLVEVYTDASYASSNLKSISGVVCFYAGAPVFWITCRQSFVTLSTAESELMSMLEGLTALRCVKSIVQMLQPGPIEGRMYSDSTAGISIVSGTTGSWRTRHLRIRAQGLHEAVEDGETTLEHQSGKLLVADGMTKQLQGALLRHLIQALKMTPDPKEVISVKKLGEGGDQRRRLQDCLALLVVSTSVIAASAEEMDLDQPAARSDDTSWIFLMVAVAVILVLVDMCSRFGVDMLRRWIRREEPDLKVKLMHELATVPARGTEGSAGLDLTTVEEYRIPAGEYVLVRTGIAVELPYGSYGRIATRSSLAAKGIEIGGGVIDRDYRGEIKVLVQNLSAMEFSIRPGDRVAQLIVEKVMEVQVRQVDTLSTTARGLGGFGSTNIGDSSRGVTSFSLKHVGQVEPTDQVQKGGSGPEAQKGGSGPVPTQPESSSRGQNAERVERQVEEVASSSIPSSRPSPIILSPATLMRTTNQQSSSAARTSTIPKSPGGRDSLGESLKRRRCSKPIPPTSTGFQALCGETDLGPPDVYPEYYLTERGYWPLERSNDLWNLVINRPPVKAPGTTKEFKLTDEVDAIVRIHSTPRHKLYDFEDIPGERSIYGTMQLTIAWLYLNQKAVVCSQRRGRKSPYMDETWTGFTIHLRIAESKGISKGLSG
eukprot:s236_g26.t1